MLGDLPISRTPQLDSSAYVGWAGALVNNGSFWPVYPEHAPGYPIFLSVDPRRRRRLADRGAHRPVDPGRNRLRADRASGVADAHATRFPAGRPAARPLRPADLHRYGAARREPLHLPVDPRARSGDARDRPHAGVYRRPGAWPGHDREADRARRGGRVRDRPVTDSHQAARHRPATGGRLCRGCARRDRAGRREELACHRRTDGAGLRRHELLSRQSAGRHWHGERTARWRVGRARRRGQSIRLWPQRTGRVLFPENI